MVFFVALKLLSSYSRVLHIGNVITFKLFILFGSFLTSAIITKNRDHSQPAFTCSNLTTETLEEGVKYVQS